MFIDCVFYDEKRTAKNFLVCEQTKNTGTVKIQEGCAKIGPSFCCGHDFVTDILIPETVKEIDKGAFNYCTNLKKITLPKYLEKIKPSVFENCEKLKTIEISEYTAKKNKEFIKKNFDKIKIVEMSIDDTFFENKSFREINKLYKEMKE